MVPRYLDDQYHHWNTRNNPNTLPTTFNAEPEYVRRLSYQLVSKNKYCIFLGKCVKSAN
jgi:hypothetical protein